MMASSKLRWDHEDPMKLYIEERKQKEKAERVEQLKALVFSSDTSSDSESGRRSKHKKKKSKQKRSRNRSNSESAEPNRGNSFKDGGQSKKRKYEDVMEGWVEKSCKSNDASGKSDYSKVNRHRKHKKHKDKHRHKKRKKKEK